MVFKHVKSNVILHKNQNNIFLIYRKNIFSILSADINRKISPTTIQNYMLHTL